MSQPPFDWYEPSASLVTLLIRILTSRTNPHTIIPKTDTDRAVERRRKNELGIPSFSALSSAATSADPYAGFSQPRRYPSGPLSRYQKFMRMGSEKLRYHFTKRFGDIITERSVYGFYPWD